MKINKNKIFDSIVTILIFVEYLYIIAFYSFVIRARFILSKWPFYNNPDPKLLHFNMHEKIVDYCMVYSFASIALILILFLMSIFINIKIKKIYMIFYLLGIFIILYNLVVDPFFEWYAD